MENKDIKHKSLYLQLLRENNIWKRNSKNLYSLESELELYKVSEMYEKFVEENEDNVDKFINFTLDNGLDKKEKYLVENYFGLFRDNIGIADMAKKIYVSINKKKTQETIRKELSIRQRNAMHKLRYKLRYKKEFKEQKENIDTLIKKYEIKLTSTV